MDIILKASIPHLFDLGPDKAYEQRGQKFISVSQLIRHHTHFMFLTHFFPLMLTALSIMLLYAKSLYLVSIFSGYI